MKTTRVAVLFLLAAAQATAGLPPEGWPQSRRDAALSGQSTETALTAPRVRWTTMVGENFQGEPSILGDALSLITDAGVLSFHARTGIQRWSHAEDRSLQLAPVFSSLATDEDGKVLAGRSTDPQAWLGDLNLVRLLTALASYAIDNNHYPSSTDLAAVLTPTYIKTLPENLGGHRAMVSSATPSTGDYRYERVTESSYHLGIWASDEGLLQPLETCGTGATDGHLGLAPSWPVSEKGGGVPTFFAADGSVLWEERTSLPASAVTPSLTEAGVVWSLASSLARSAQNFWYRPWVESYQAGLWDFRYSRLASAGRIRATDLATGTLTWEASFSAPTRGAVARATSTGHLFSSLGPSSLGAPWMRQVRTLATAVESWSIDNNRYPDTGELRPTLDPTHLNCWPVNLITGEPIAYSATPSAGDYQYTSVDGTEYTLNIWGERGEAAIVFETGSFVDWDGDEPASIVSLTSDGVLRWRTWLGVPSQDLTPLALNSAGSLLVASSAGTVRALSPATGLTLWTTELGLSLSLPPALLPDGGSAWVVDTGHLILLDGTGTVTGRYWAGADVSAAPSTTADGVIYLADRAGTLHAVGQDGIARWTIQLGGPERVALTTTPVQVNQWIYVGRDDGVLVAVVERSTGGVHPPNGLLMLSKTLPVSGVRLSWAGLTLPELRGAHAHLRRWDGGLLGRGTQLLPENNSDTVFVDEAATDALSYYRVMTADSGENESW